MRRTRESEEQQDSGPPPEAARTKQASAAPVTDVRAHPPCSGEGGRAEVGKEGSDADS